MTEWQKTDKLASLKIKQDQQDLLFTGPAATSTSFSSCQLREIMQVKN